MTGRNGAQVLVQTLIDQGIDTVFGYPGGTVLDIYDALYDRADEIHHIETTHEQHACHAADGYSRATGKTGVVIATSGPGATNLVTGIATAYLDSIPLVAITGNVSNAMIGTDAFQELDITGVTLPITKHNYFVRDGSRLQEIVREAFELANSGRKGPVLVDIPKDVQASPCPYEKLPAVVEPSRAPATDVELERAAAAINASKRPFVYFGGGTVSSGAGAEVVALAEKIGAPLGCSLMGVSAIPTDTPGFLGMQGMHGHYAATKAMNRTDCLIALGCRFNDRSTGNRLTFPANGTVVHVDIDSSELSKTLDDQVEVHGDIKASLARLIDMVEKSERPQWRAKVEELVATERELADRREGILTPRTVMETINRLREPEMRVVTDVGQHQMWAAQYLSFSRPRTFVTSGGLGTMGFGMGASVGSALSTGEQTILITGDGSFAMDMAELVTAADHELPITVVLLNNGVLGMVRQMQSLFMDKRYSQTTLDRKVDYVRVAQAMGAEGRRVETPEEFEAALAEALATKGPALIECPIDADELVLPALQIGASMDELIVDQEDIKARMGE